MKKCWLKDNPYNNVWTFVAAALVVAPVLIVWLYPARLTANSSLTWRSIAVVFILILSYLAFYRIIRMWIHRMIPSLFLATSLTTLSAGMLMWKTKALIFRPSAVSALIKLIGTDIAKWGCYVLLIGALSTLIGEAAKNVYYNAGGKETENSRAIGARFKQERRLLISHAVKYPAIVFLVCFVISGAVLLGLYSTGNTYGFFTWIKYIIIDRLFKINLFELIGSATEASLLLLTWVYVLSAFLGISGFAATLTVSDEGLLNAERHYLVGLSKTFQKNYEEGKKPRLCEDYFQVFANYCCSKSGVASRSLDNKANYYIQEIFQKSKKQYELISKIVQTQSKIQAIYIDGQYGRAESIEIEAQMADWLAETVLRNDSQDDSSGVASSLLEVFKIAVKCMFRSSQVQDKKTIEKIWEQRLFGCGITTKQAIRLNVLDLFRNFSPTYQKSDDCSMLDRYAYLLAFPFYALDAISKRFQSRDTENTSLLFLSPEFARQELVDDWKLRISGSAAIEHYYWELFIRNIGIEDTEESTDIQSVQNAFRAAILSNNYFNDILDKRGLLRFFELRNIDSQKYEWFARCNPKQRNALNLILNDMELRAINLPDDQGMANEALNRLLCEAITKSICEKRDETNGQ